MIQLHPVGSADFVQLCGTTPCSVCGAGDLKTVLRAKIGEPHHVSADGKLSWEEVECLGACCNAPMAAINDYYYEDLTPETLGQILDDFQAGKSPKPGSYAGRGASEPKGAIQTLTDPRLYDGSAAKPMTIPNLPQKEPA
ncbi:MAG: NADH-quinone oxidoreductase, subunit [Caulobacteraceae bacterium]|nr:NADH-quinone oxidoreductase, subunit [Caulobacteraceae bacterium]